MIQPQITLQSYLHSETFNLVRHLEVTCNARYVFLEHWRTTFKRCSQSIASVRLLSPFRMSDFRTIAFALHLEHVSGKRVFIWDEFLNLNLALNPPVTWHLSFVSKTYIELILQQTVLWLLVALGRKLRKLGGLLHKTSFTTFFSSPDGMHTACS